MLSVLSPRNLFRAALDVELSSTEALEIAAGDRSARLRWAEHRNRLHVFKLFQYADLILGAGPGSDPAALVVAARDIDPIDRAWVIEGGGYWWGSRESWRGTCRSSTGQRMPEASLIPLHSGVGLSIATRWLRDVRPSTLSARLESCLDECCAFAWPGFERIAIETSGLAVRNLCPQLAPLFDQALAESAPSLRACFWHGLGRGAYFAPSNWAVSAESAIESLERLWRLASDDAAKDFVLRGFVWAATLVNLRTPAVLQQYADLMEHARDRRGFARGVLSALLAWQHMTPEDAGPARILTRELREPAVDEAWFPLVAEPARQAIRLFRPLVDQGRLVDSFFGGEP